MMMNANKREALRLKCKSGNSVPVRNVMIRTEELLELLGESEAKEAVESVIAHMRADAQWIRNSEFVTDEMDARAMAVARNEERWALALDQALGRE